MAPDPSKQSIVRRPYGFVCLCLCSFLLSAAVTVRSQQPSSSAVPASNNSDSAAPGSSAPQQSDQQATGNVKGKVVDQSGATITGVALKLMRNGQSLSPVVTSDEEGQFFFANIPPGPFQLTFASDGLTSKTVAGTVEPAKTYTVPPVTLTVATQVTEVRVGLPPAELAEEQVKEQEKQRVLGVIPNFYVTYEQDAAPLPAKLKYKLAWKTTVDPFTLVAVGAVAGLNQAGDRWSGFGQGMSGYAKRYGATYGDVAIGTFMGGAVLPSLLKQDPRYFYRGKGSKASRLLYALSASVICKGDNGHWQPNYSNVGGNLAAGAISNLYYPARDRNGANLVFTNAAIRIAETAAANVLQEFLIPRLTPERRGRSTSQP
jgi:Carboxypeptidase regulatory-like domain